MPKVSVIIPAYNHAAFVGCAIESVLGQSFQDFELIVNDDASTDSTPEVIRSIKDPRVLSNLFSKNRGASWTVNAALRQARGQYFAILNSDDYFLPGKLDLQVRFLDENPRIAAVFGLPCFIDERGEPLADDEHPFSNWFETKNQSREEWLRRFFIIGNQLCHPTVMVRRSCCDEVGAYDPRLAQTPDFDLWIRICSRHNIHILPQPVTAYRVFEGGRNASAQTPLAIARTQWEFQYLLRRFLDLADDELRRIFSTEFAELDPEGSQAPKVLLGRLSLKLGQWWPPYRSFGLDVLHQELASGECAVSYREYMRFTGACDVFSHNLRIERGQLEERLCREAEAREGLVGEIEATRASARIEREQLEGRLCREVEAREELVRVIEAMRASARIEREQLEVRLCREGDLRQDLIRTIEAMRASTSWRTTRPLRYVGDKLKPILYSLCRHS
jgi:glycosyltransferase involved in cell wall biosynthesis